MPSIGNHISKSHLVPYSRSESLRLGQVLEKHQNFFKTQEVSHWTYLEPDERLFSELVKKKCRSKSDEFICGTTEDIKDKIFDTIFVYRRSLNTLKEDDLDELESCSHLLAKNGRIIILSPAHNILFSQFDRSIGHFE